MAVLSSRRLRGRGLFCEVRVYLASCCRGADACERAGNVSRHGDDCPWQSPPSSRQLASLASTGRPNLFRLAEPLAPDCPWYGGVWLPKGVVPVAVALTAALVLLLVAVIGIIMQVGQNRRAAPAN